MDESGARNLQVSYDRNASLDQRSAVRNRKDCATSCASRKLEVSAYPRNGQPPLRSVVPTLLRTNRNHFRGLNPRHYAVKTTDATACRFCDKERKQLTQKKRYAVCEDHFMITCPKCGHEGFWMHEMKSGSYYLCFSMNCNWLSTEPPQPHPALAVSASANSECYE